MGGLGGPRAGVGALCRLCCGAVDIGADVWGESSIITGVYQRWCCVEVFSSFWDRIWAEEDQIGVFGGEEEGGGVRSGPGAARTILLLHVISARPSKQPRMVGSNLGVYSFGLIFVSARTNKRHQHLGGQFAGGRPSVFQRSLSLLVRWDTAWGCGGGRAEAWASSGRGPLQQACGFTAV